MDSKNVLEDSIPENAEDSAMEDAETEFQEVAGIATAARMIQLASNPLVVPHNEYASPSEALPWPRFEAPTFVNTLVPSFEPRMLRKLHAPNSVAPQKFLKTAPLQDNAPLFVSDASTFVAESHLNIRN